MILGISLNSRTLGMAVLDQDTLVDYRVKLFKDRWSKEKVQKIIACISSYIQEYAIKHTALILPYPHYTNSETSELLDKIKKHFKDHKIAFTCYEVAALQSLCENVRAKKKALMQALSLLHPELSLAEKKELRNKKKYYNKLFEAVGAAMLLAKKLES